MKLSLLAYQAAAAAQEELGSAAADWEYSAEPWEVAGERDSALTGLHLHTHKKNSVTWAKHFELTS